jgi:prepilin peptidase CpaA
MEFPALHFGLLLITGLAVGIAMVYDVRWRRIPNFITFPSMITGITIHTLNSGWQGFCFSLGGLVLGGGIFLIIYIFGAMGAGDVKMIAGVGALLGMPKIFSVLFLTVLAGALMAVYKILAVYISRKKSRKRIKDKISVSETNPLQQSIPYGVAIGFGTLIAMVL